MKRDAFQAIADPTRREILNLLAYQSLNVNAVAENFEMSRAAVYKHMKMLTECGLIVVKQYGRERYCEAKLQQLSQVSDWVEQYRKIWSSRFDKLDDFLKEYQAKNKNLRSGKKATGKTKRKK